jgi:cation diffusion facilitator family transporter
LSIGATRAAPTDVHVTHWTVLFSLVVNCAETLALGVAAALTGSVALRAQTAANAADVAVSLFLLIGVLRSVRPPDATHPIGYGREGFFWSLFAALGIFVGGGGLALNEAIRSVMYPSSVDSYAIAYLVLAATIVVDIVSLAIPLQVVRRRAAARRASWLTYLKGSTDPAATTVLVIAGCSVISGFIAAAGLMLSQATGSPAPDTVASALVGVVLLVASALLLRTNRGLLTGRGVPLPVVHEMRRVVAAEDGVVDVPDLFAVVVGPSSLIVDGDVTFADELNVPAVEQAIMRAAAALRQRWPSIEYIYLTPVPHARPRRAKRSSARAVAAM